MTGTLFLCDGAKPSASLRRQRWDAQESIATVDAGGELNLRIDNIEHLLLGSVQDRAADLVRLAAFVYAADQMVSRGGETDLMGGDWSRTLALCVRVRDVDFWTQEGLAGRLAELLAFVSDDNWQFAFSAGGPRSLEPVLGLNSAEVMGQPDCVALFSGGMDSLCAVVEQRARLGRKPLLLSHRSNGYFDGRQKQLVGHLRERVPEWAFPHTSVWVHRKGSEPKESTQRTRSFLFAALGAAAAIALGIRDVVLADNGIVSLGLPINDQLVGTLTSRSTHPKFLYLMNRFLETMWDQPPVVRNPLWDRMRTEGLELLKQHGLQALLQETNSCAATRNRPRVTPHCGVCSQCIDRRFASLAAGLEEYDLSERYETDVFRDGLTDWKRRTMAMGYVSFAQRVGRLESDDALYTAFPQFADAFHETDPELSENTLAAMALVRRHAGSVRHVMGLQIAGAHDELAAGLLPSDCLIRLVSSPSMGVGTEVRPRARVVDLSAAQEAEFVAHGCKSRLPIFVTGRTAKRASNLVEVGDQTIEVDTAELALFLQLIVGLHEHWDRGGWVPFSRIQFWPTHRPSYSRSGGLAVEKSLSRLRKPFGLLVKELRPTELFERKAGRVRLSTHPKFVDGEWTKLVDHGHEGVVTLATKLIDLSDFENRSAGPGSR